MSCSDPPLTYRWLEDTATEHPSSGVVVFAHHPEGGTYGAIVVVRVLSSPTPVFHPITVSVSLPFRALRRVGYDLVML